MPSYRYTREFKPEDLQPPPPPEYSNKEKAKNWWQYHKVWIAVGLVVAVLVGFFVYEVVTQVKPDLNVGIIAPYALPDGLVEKLQQGLAPYVEDLNGDGQVNVQVDVYTISARGGEEELPLGDLSGPIGVTSAAANNANEDPYQQMAGVVRLTGAFEEGNPVLFLLEPENAPAYQEAYAMLGNPDGTEAGETADLEAVSVRLGDLPGFAEMDLLFEYYEGTEIDGHLLLDDYRVGTRALYGSRLETQAGGAERWHYARDLLARLQEAPAG